MDENDELLKTWCRDEDVNYEVAHELKIKIFPLIEYGHNIFGDLFDRIYWNDIKGVHIRYMNIARLLETSRHIDLIIPNLNRSKRAALALHIQILPLIEGLFMNEINYLVYTLMMNDKEIFVPWLKRNANSLEEISLKLKLNHLKKQGFDTISDNIDADLRNSIAHMFYNIDNNGDIFVEGEKKDVEDAYKKIRNITHSIHLVKRIYYRRFRGA